MLAFSKEEYQQRFNNTRKSMAEKGIDLLLVSDPSNLCYLTGFRGWSFYVHQMVIVSLEEDQPYIIVRGQDTFAPVLTTWLDADHIIGYPDYHVQNSVDHTMDFISKFINEKHLADNKVVAVEKESFYFPTMCGERINAGLKNAKAIVDADRLVNWVKVVKSDAEIECVKKAGRITTNILNTVIDKVNVGVRQCDVAAAAYYAGISGTEEYGGDIAAMFPFMGCGIRSAACHLPWTDDKYEEGQSLIFEYAGVYNRYHAPSARTIAIGKPQQELVDVSNVVIEGLEAALDAVKPGVTGEDVEHAWNVVIKKHGIIKDSRIGYSTGLSYPPDWGESTISLRPGEKGILQENMVFHIIPGIWTKDFGVHFSECFIVTKNGCEVMAQVPRKLAIK